MAKQPGVARADLLTRLIDVPDLGDEYAPPLESLGNGVNIIRIKAGP